MSNKEQIIKVERLPIDITNGATYFINQTNPNSYTHGMFKYPCKFIPEIPRWGINKFLVNQSGIIFDPFCGSGTTLLEANIHGVNAYGSEIDDVAKLIVNVKTTVFTTQQVKRLNKEYENILKVLKNDAAEYFTPAIENLQHWFPQNTILELGRMKKYIDTIDDDRIKDFFKLCMISIIKKVSYADDTSPKPYVSNKIIKSPPLVEKEFSSTFKRYIQMSKDITTIKNFGNTHIVKGDALNFESPKKIDLAITSPPYINAFDYGRTMRLENLWLDTLTEDELRNKKSQYVGTEKINLKQEKNNLNILEKSSFLKEYFDRIVSIDEKRALIVKKFFEDMETNLQQVYNQMNNGGKYIIVIGKSSIRNVDIESWKVLEQLAHKIGFNTVEYFSYVIRNPYIRIPRNGRGGKINKDYVLVLQKGDQVMAQQNRSKEIWLIPKRVNLHQTICLIDGIIDRNYDGTTWNPQKQNNLGVNLKKWGATRDGKNISPQAIRTLVASIPQYLGFAYINTEKTPNTICLTKAGLKLWEQHKDQLVKVNNLLEGSDYLIAESDVVLHQMEKLQITNPIIEKDCQNIYVFPFRFMLNILLKVNYLDKEEIAYFLFKVRSDDEVDLIVQEILNFRKLSTQDRNNIINAFKKTHVGNITLVQAPSTAYFISLCQITGIIDKVNIKPNNKEISIVALKIKDTYKEYVKEILNEKYKNIHTFNFENNLQLWIDYIGTPERNYPPINVLMTNDTDNQFLIQILQDGRYKYVDLIENNGTVSFPMFFNEQYNVKVIDIMTGEELDDYNICPTINQTVFAINVESANNSSKVETLEEIGQEIIQHCQSKNFAGKTLNYLTTLSKTTGEDYINKTNLRGAYFEYYVYKMLNVLKENDIIDEVIWNGHIGKYRLPVSAPGGRVGTPDIIFTIDDLHIVIELTTIKSKTLQFSAEGSSVPDHIRLYKEESEKEVVGVFCAPIIYERNIAAMKSTIAPYNINLLCLTDIELVEVLKSNDRYIIKKFFTK